LIIFKTKEVVAIKAWTETKKGLSGKTQSINCELVVRDDYFAILKHTVQTGFQGEKVGIVPGNVSYRFHWPNRSYNLAKFFGADGTLLANCFQLVDSVELAEKAVVWRDLSITIWVAPDGAIQVVNAADRPALTDTWLHIFIEATKQELLRKYPEIIVETDQILQKYPVELKP
jgi:hypothetical protein